MESSLSIPQAPDKNTLVSEDSIDPSPIKKLGHHDPGLFAFHYLTSRLPPSLYNNNMSYYKTILFTIVAHTKENSPIVVKSYYI